MALSIRSRKGSVLQRSGRDMTCGSIVGHLFFFAVPLLIGNIFQQMYNTVDSIIVGNYVGKEALAAIGGSAPITSLFINFFSGLTSGAGVVISNYYGAKDEKRLNGAVQTTFTVMLIMSVIITFLGIVLTPLMLRLMKTPEDVFNQAALYLKIYFAGISGLLLYNVGAGILRAVGDSETPLFILILCTVLNIILDYIFVKPLCWGIAGAAVATILSQFVSAVLVFAILGRTKAAYRVDLTKPSICGPLLKAIAKIGMPTAIQMAVTSFSNIFVLSYINAFGSDYMAGWAAYIRIDNFAIQPVLSLSIAITTFVGQNLGAGKTERVRVMPGYGLLMAAGILLMTILPVILFAPQLVRLFGDSPELIACGTYFIRTISPCYAAFGINQVYGGILAGKGDTKVSMGIMLFSFVLFRQLYLYIVSRMGLGLQAVTYGYPVGWAMCAVLFLAYYYSVGKNRNKLNL